jgi:hypothetical protein
MHETLKRTKAALADCVHIGKSSHHSLVLMVLLVPGFFLQPSRAGTHNGKLVTRRTSAGAFHISTLGLKSGVGVPKSFQEKRADELVG